MKIEASSCLYRWASLWGQCADDLIIWVKSWLAGLCMGFNVSPGFLRAGHHQHILQMGQLWPKQGSRATSCHSLQLASLI